MNKIFEIDKIVAWGALVLLFLFAMGAYGIKAGPVVDEATGCGYWAEGTET